MNVSKHIFLSVLLLCLSVFSFAQTSPWGFTWGVQYSNYFKNVYVYESSTSNIQIDSGDYIGAFRLADTAWVCVGAGQATNDTSVFWSYFVTDINPIEVKFKMRKIGEGCDREVLLREDPWYHPIEVLDTNLATIESPNAMLVEEVEYDGVNPTIMYDIEVSDTVVDPLNNPWVFYNSADLQIENEQNIVLTSDLTEGWYNVDVNGSNMCSIGMSGAAFLQVNVEVRSGTSRISASALSPFTGSSVQSIIIYAEEGFKIYNQLGEVVFTAYGRTEWSGLDLSGSQLSAGPYYIIFDDDSKEEIDIIR